MEYVPSRGTVKRTLVASVSMRSGVVPAASVETTLACADFAPSGSRSLTASWSAVSLSRVVVHHVQHTAPLLRLGNQIDNHRPGCNHLYWKRVPGGQRTASRNWPAFFGFFQNRLSISK